MIGFVLFVCSVLGVVLTAEGKSKESPNEVYLNICTNFKDPSKMTLKEYMNEFAIGPCAPLILLPGIEGSALRVVIDCPKFRAAYPETFLSCGWTTCEGDIGYSAKTTPQKEYQMWIPYATSPMSLNIPSQFARDCWGGLAQLVYKNVSGKLVPQNKTGIVASAKGLTPDTMTYKGSKCGQLGVEYLLEDLEIGPESDLYLAGIIDRMLLMGYKSGLTFQAVPYDFRINSGNDIVSLNLGSLIKTLKAFTNKKVVIAAHSMGNTKTVYALWGMSQQDKDNNIATYVALAPPYSGAPKVIDFLLCGDSGLFKDSVGVDMKTFKYSIGTFSSIWELGPWTSWYTQANTPWMQKLQARLAYEQGKSTDPVFPFLPTTDKICYPNYNAKQCTSGLEVFDNFATILGQPVTAQNLRSMINQYTFANLSSQIYDMLDQRYETLPNPGTTMVIVYSQTVGTFGRFNFKIDPRTMTSQDQYCNSSQVSWSYWKGDGTVPSTSVVTAALKWADEFNTKSVSGARPVKLVDLCSEYNVQTNPFDGKSATGQKIINDVGYIGVPCDCTQSKTRHCSHDGMLFSNTIWDFLSETLTNNDRTTVSSIVANMTEQDLQNYQQTCTMIKTLIPTQSSNSHRARLFTSKITKVDS